VSSRLVANVLTGLVLSLKCLQQTVANRQQQLATTITSPREDCKKLENLNTWTAMEKKVQDHVVWHCITGGISSIDK